VVTENTKDLQYEDDDWFSIYSVTPEYQIYNKLCDVFNDKIDDEKFVKIYNMVSQLNQQGEGESSYWFIPDGSKEFLVNCFMGMVHWYDDTKEEESHQNLLALKERLYKEYLYIKELDKSVNTDKYVLTYLYDICYGVVMDLHKNGKINDSEMTLLRDYFRVMFVKCSEYCLPF
jgi:hypothetical protein